MTEFKEAKKGGWINVNNIFQAVLIAMVVGIYAKLDNALETIIVQKEQITIMREDLQNIKANIKEVRLDLYQVSKDTERLKVRVNG